VITLLLCVKKSVVNCVNEDSSLNVRVSVVKHFSLAWWNWSLDLLLWQENYVCL